MKTGKFILAGDRKSFTPLEKAADFSRRLSNCKADAGIKLPSAQPVRELCPLTGFTLTELMVAFSIFLIILFIFLFLFSSGQVYWEIGQIRTDLYQNARRASQEIYREVSESQSGACATFTFIDPQNGEYKQGVWFASARGSDSDGPEDAAEGTNNNYVHINSTTNAVTWRSAIIYCPYQEPSGIKQLRRYVDYGQVINYYGGVNIFPLTFISATNTTLTFQRSDSSFFTIDRSTGRVLANYLDTEDTNNNNVLDANENDGAASLPVDNADGVLNYGVNFSKSAGKLTINLFLRRELTRIKQQGLTLAVTSSQVIKFRQP